MRTCVRLLCVFTLAAVPAAAQTTTEDGIRAMVRGDYQTAARILRPLADDMSRPDPVAQFFLAMLYDSGQGVGLNMQRACSLFLKSAGRESPFQQQSAAIAAEMRARLGGGADLLCVAEESWRGGPPQSFVLGTDHRILFADTSITVEYGGKEQQTLLRLPPEAVFLPIQYTPLSVTKPIATRRHFFQWLAWMPEATAGTPSWTLGWSLSEVVGDQWIYVASEKSLAVVKGDVPPASYDVASLVQLHVNANGEAEYTTFGVGSSRTEVIPWKGAR